ncbi:MAG TPA: hypothetical protein VGG56_12420 [Terracidiphilus sp.]|jgi:tetratricopeptide (TPR) repeat protein
MGVCPALMAAAISLAVPAHAALAQNAAPAQNQIQSLAEANAALQSGEADKALALLASLPQSGPDLALAHNLACRVRFTLEQWDAAANECELAERLDDGNSDYHLWLGRALGEKASRASFLTAYTLAKRTRAEFEEAVRLNPRNAEALSDLGDFYRQAPGVVGGGIDKAQQIVTALDKVDASRAQELRGRMAEQQKDFTAAENDYRKMVATGTHPALGWSALAGFYARRQRFNEMESAVQNILATAPHDRHASVTLYDGAGLLTESNRDPALAATLLEDYLASSSKTEEAPAFIAHIRLARLKQELGDPEAAGRERIAALALAREYVPAQNFNPQAASNQRAAVH